MTTPKYLNPDWRESTYRRVRAIIESCETMDQFDCAARMAISYSNQLWEWRRFVKNSGWVHSDLIHLALLVKLKKLNHTT